MKKFLLITAAILFFSALFINEERAQVPMPGQAMPLYCDSYRSSYNNGGSCTYWTGIHHYGGGQGSGCYSLKEYSRLYKYINDSWVQQGRVNNCIRTYCFGDSVNVNRS